MDKFQLAKYIVSKYHGTVSPMKLQKLMYYSYAWQLVADMKLFDAHFEAWSHGPVDPDIYKEYKGFGRNPIVISDAPHLNEPLIDFILDSYAVYSAIELSKTTHLEQPWKHYQENGELIPDEVLISFYSKQAFAKNFPLKKGKKYFPPKTSSHYAFTFDMEKEYVPEFKNITEYLDNFAIEEKRLSQMLHKYGLKN
ncbi:MAG: type II toxin-antitoxin system antitoxin SocA domain-containing protein [Balneolaceae bacterium]